MTEGEVRQDRKLLYHTVQKIKRTFTAFLPADKSRRGQCDRCGECCKMGWTCPFLRYVEKDGRKLAVCAIHRIRPMNCRTYPRTRDEQLVHPCGYYFENGWPKTDES